MKELTLDVQNVVAPPKTKLKLPKKEKSSAIEGELATHTSDVESKPSKLGPESGEVVENGVMGSQKDGTVRSPHGSPSARSFQESPRDGSKDNHFDKSLSSNASPRAEKTHRYVFMIYVRNMQHHGLMPLSFFNPLFFYRESTE